VDDHPYYTRTDAAGRFTLSQVPAGDYELVAWLPSWHIAGREYDPESRSALRLFYESPRQLSQSVHVQAQKECPAQFAFHAELFDQDPRRKTGLKP
jgi:hypothetical protein